MASALNYKIVCHHDVHGDIVCVEIFEDHVLKARCGYKDACQRKHLTNEVMTEIQKNVYWGGPMWVIYNTLKGDLRDTTPWEDLSLPRP